ncbi:MAG: glycosyltransferase family 4 protein, partial [Victivallales bacterium]|nr:glycosyltransferase family 4 protein [Victivallales bacterium]
MAQGCIPIIRDWTGSDRLYPKEYVWHDVKEAVRKIRACRRSPAVFFSEMQKCRQYALRRFDARAICLQYDEIFSRHPSWTSVRELFPLSGICVAQLVWIPAGCHNGYRVRVEKFSAQYRQLGMRTVLICLHDGKASEGDLELHRRDFERLGCHAYVVPVSEFFASRISAGAQDDIVRKLKPILDNEHVDVLQTHALYCGRIGKLLKAARPETLFACVFHGVNPEEAAMSGSAPARVKMLEELEWDLLKSVDFANYVSNAMESHYLAKYGLLRPSCIVPSALRKEALRSNIKNRRILSLPSGRPVLGYVGTLVAWQCKDEMFKLFGRIHKLHKNVFFAVLTQAPYHDEVHRLMAEHGIGERDYLVQEVKFDDVSAAVSQFNAGVMLRKWSPVNRVASPTKFGEMIAAGVPIVATDGIGDFSEDVRKNDFGVIVPLAELDAQSFSEETCESIYGLLKERRNESKEYILRSEKFCRDNLIWEEHVTCMADWYWKLLNVKVDGSPAPL